MIVDQQTRDGFLHDALERDIEEVIQQTVHPGL